MKSRLNFLLKNILIMLISFFKSVNLKDGAILMYHSISYNKAFFNVTPESFVKHIKFLVDKKYKIIKLSDMINRIKNSEPISGLVSLTFDDGYADIYQVVFPILKEYKIPISVFVPTDFIGRELKTSDGVTIKNLNEEQIKILDSSGFVEFFPHSMSHRNMDTLVISDFIKEAELSFNILSKISSNTQKIFSYPRGRFYDEMINYLKKNNWHGAVTVQEGMVSLGDNIFKLKRLAVVSNTSFFQFKSKIFGYTEYYELIKDYFFRK